MKSERLPGRDPRLQEMGPPADAWARAALEFLERSRDVADERVVDLARGETSPSRREEVIAPGPRSAVR